MSLRVSTFAAKLNGQHEKSNVQFIIHGAERITFRFLSVSLVIGQLLTDQ